VDGITQLFRSLGVSGMVLLSLSTSCAVISALLTSQEIGEVNRKLPDDKQISYLFMYPGKMQQIREEYRRFYPQGRVDFWAKAFEMGMFLFLACAAAKMFLFR
jgi:hypothetical protein